MRITHTNPPCHPRKSNKEAANAQAAAHDKMEDHHSFHAYSKRRCNTKGSELKRAFASTWTNVRASLEPTAAHFQSQDHQASSCSCAIERTWLLCACGRSIWHWFAISPNHRRGLCPRRVGPAKQWQAVGNNLQPLVIVGIGHSVQQDTAFFRLKPPSLLSAIRKVRRSQCCKNQCSPHVVQLRFRRWVFNSM